MTWPDALLQGPVQARLMVQNLNGTGLQQLVLFNSGLYPLGLTWSTDGTQLIFSIANQAQQSGGYSPSGVAQTAVVRAISAAGGTPVAVPGIDAGFFPGQPSIVTGGVDLSKVHLRLAPAAGGGFVLTTAGLNPAATYRLESTTDLSGAFGNSQNFTGAQIMNGIAIPQTETQKFFRLATP